MRLLRQRMRRSGGGGGLGVDGGHRRGLGFANLQVRAAQTRNPSRAGEDVEGRVGTGQDRGQLRHIPNHSCTQQWWGGPLTQFGLTQVLDGLYLRVIRPITRMPFGGPVSVSESPCHVQPGLLHKWATSKMSFRLLSYCANILIFKTYSCCIKRELEGCRLHTLGYIVEQ
jgi:hypothetical protein